MNDVSKRPFYKRIHWMVYALVAPLLLQGAYRLWVGPGQRVELVGSGVIADLAEGDAPEGSRYVLESVSGESLDETTTRVRALIATWPDLFVFAFDAATRDDPRLEGTMDALLTEAENAASVPIVVGFEDSPPWFDSLCDRSARRLCVEPGANPAAAVGAAVQEGWQRHRDFEATTQVGR